MSFEQFPHEEDYVEILSLGPWCVRVSGLDCVLEPLAHDVEKELETVARQVHLGPVEGIDELRAIDVAVAASVGRSQGLLKWNPLRREGQGPDLLQDFLRPVQVDLLVEFDLFSVEALDQGDLDDAGVERVQLVHYHFDILV